MKSITMPVLGILFLFGPLCAADLRFLAWDDEVAARKIAVRNGDKVVEIQDLHPGKRTKPIPAGDVPTLVAPDREAADGKTASVQINVAADIQSPLVLVLPDPNSATGLRTLVIDDSPARFPWGTVRLLNAAGQSLEMRQEKTVAALPASWSAVDVALGAMRNIGVQVVASANTKALLHSGVWEHDPDLLKLAFIIPREDAGSRNFDIKVVPENRRAQVPAVP